MALQLGPLQNIAPRSQVAPITDFMEAVRSGFLTVDDINSRTRSNINQGAATATNLQAQDLQQRQIAGQIELLPGQLENAALAQSNQQSQLVGQGALARAAVPAAQAEEARSRPDTREGQLRNDYQNNLITKAVQYFGEAPEILEVPSAIKTPPVPFEQWLTTTYAAPELQNDNEGTRNQYALYVQQNANPTEILEKGSPAYNQELARRIQDFEIKAATQGAQLKALPGVIEARAKGAAEAPVKQAAQVADLRKEYSALPEIHDLRKVDAAYNKILQSTDPASPASPLRDQATIFSWMKILDPGSTVREGEYASVKNARGIPDRIRNVYNQALTGQILTPEQRLELRAASEPLFLGQVQNVAPRIRQFLQQEQQIGLVGQVVPPEDAALLLRIAPGAATAGAAPSAAPKTPVTLAPLAIGQLITVPRDITTADGRTFRKGQSVKIKALDTNGNPTDIE